MTLGPGDVDIGFAGRIALSDQTHSRISGISWGTEIIVSGRQISTSHGGAVGRLAAKTEPRPMVTKGTATGILVRTRAQTAPEFQSGLKSDRWETVLVELVVESEELLPGG